MWRPTAKRKALSPDKSVAKVKKVALRRAELAGEFVAELSRFSEGEHMDHTTDRDLDARLTRIAVDAADSVVSGHRGSGRCQPSWRRNSS